MTAPAQYPIQHVWGLDEAQAPAEPLATILRDATTGERCDWEGGRLDGSISVGKGSSGRTSSPLEHLQPAGVDIPDCLVSAKDNNAHIDQSCPRQQAKDSHSPLSRRAHDCVDPAMRPTADGIEPVVDAALDLHACRNGPPTSIGLLRRT